MRFLIIGYGRQGEAVRGYLIKLGIYPEDILVHDRDERILDRCEKDNIPCLRSINKRSIKGVGPSVVVCCSPQITSFFYAEMCSDIGISFCDLGGDQKIASMINRLGRKGVPFCANAGLAPGWVNYLALSMTKGFKGSKDVEILCGGVPDKKGVNDLEYALSFSVCGVVKEYTCPAHVIIDGEIKTISPTGWETKEEVMEDGSIMESAITGGCSSLEFLNSLVKSGVRNFSYRTLRWPGHWKIIRDLYNDDSKSKLEFPTRLENLLFSLPCVSVDGVKDVIFIRSSVKDEIIEKTCNMTIRQNGSLTAMQVATASSVAIIAYQIGSGSFDEYSYIDAHNILVEPFFHSMAYLIGELGIVSSTKVGS